MQSSLSRSKLLLPATFIMAFLLGYYIATYQYSLLGMAADFSLSNSQIGILVGLNYGAHMFIPVLFGILADRFGKKPFLIAGCGLLLCGVALMFAADGYASMIGITFIAGSGFGAMQTLYLSMLADTYPHNVTRYTNFAQTVFGLGAFLGPLFAAGLVEQGWTWRQSFTPIMLFLVAVIVMVVFTKAGEKRVADTERGKGAAAVFKSPLFYIILIWMVTYMGIEMPTSSFADAFFVRQLSAPEFSALALSLYWIMMVPSRMMMGFVKSNHLRLIAIFSVGVVICAAGIGWSQNYILSMVLFAAAGFFCGPIWPTIFACSQKAFPHATGTVGSFCTAFGGLGGFMFPAIFGALSDGASLTAVYFAIAGVAALCFIFTLVTKRSMRKASVE